MIQFKHSRVVIIVDIHSIRQQMKVKSIYEIPLRVTFYARVSSDKDEQLNSLDNQIEYYENLIKSNENWVYLDGYIDEGISGISTKKRENFHRMIADAKAGLFDLIVTKEISRFARNTLDSIQFTRELLSYGTGVFFQNDNINTLDEDSELRLTIMSGIAQDELRKLSSRIKFGHAQSIKNGVVLGNSRIFGYKKDNKRLIIDEDEAKMVIELFELYSTGQYSMKQIEKIFWDKGYRNHNGNRIAHTTMSNIISNPKYKGYYVGNKVKVIDMFTKKQKFLPPEEWVMFKDESGKIVPAIVSEELWDAANKVLVKRSNDVKGRKNQCNHNNILTGKLYCTHCGKPYWRTDTKSKTANDDNSRWTCSNKKSNGTHACPSFTIYEKEIIPILYDLFRQSADDIDRILNRYIELFNKVNSPVDINNEIEKLKKSIELNEKKKDKLLEYNISGQMNDKQFLSMSSRCDESITKALEEISELEQQSNTKHNIQEYVNDLRKLITLASDEVAKTMIDRAFVEKYIDSIYVTPVDEKTAKLEVRLFTGELVNAQMVKGNCHTGQIFKNICPVQHVNFVRNYRWVDGHNANFTYIVKFQL